MIQGVYAAVDASVIAPAQLIIAAAEGRHVNKHSF